MKVYIKNKIVSFGGDSTVKNENGEDIYFVDGRFMSLTRVKWVKDMNRNKLFKVRNKWRWIPFTARKALIYESGKKIATVKLPVTSIKKFVVEGCRDEIIIDGKFFSAVSQIKRNGVTIGTIDRTPEFTATQFIFGPDTFCLEAEERDIPFLIALVIAIDNICDARAKS